jgi:hypothetical protein
MGTGPEIYLRDEGRGIRGDEREGECNSGATSPFPFYLTLLRKLFCTDIWVIGGTGLGMGVSNFLK